MINDNEAKNINLAGAARSFGDPSRFFSKKRINKWRFSNIGSPDEGNSINEGMFIKPICELIDFIDSHQKFRFSFLNIHPIHPNSIFTVAMSIADRRVKRLLK